MTKILQNLLTPLPLPMYFCPFLQVFTSFSNFLQVSVRVDENSMTMLPFSHNFYFFDNCARFFKFLQVFVSMCKYVQVLASFLKNEQKTPKPYLLCMCSLHHLPERFLYFLCPSVFSHDSYFVTIVQVHALVALDLQYGNLGYKMSLFVSYCEILGRFEDA